MMKTLFLISNIFILSLCSISFGQEINSFMKTMGSLKSAKKQKFISSEIGVSINLPKRINGAGGMKNAVKYNWRLDEGYYVLGVKTKEIDVENSEKFEEETVLLTNEIFSSFARNLFATKFEVIKLDQTPLEFQGHKGFKVRAKLTDTTLLIKIFWIKNKGYFMGAVLANNQEKYEPQVEKVFESFDFITEKERQSLINNKIINNAPVHLPQTPIVKKLRSDAEDIRLNGKVKELLEYTTSIKDGKETVRKLKSKMIFNDKGNFLTAIFYVKDLPYRTKVYGYIDGHRVSKSGYVSYESSPPPPAPGPPQPASGPPPASGNIVKRDSRYHTKYAYEYDETGMLKEEIEYGNTNIITWRTVYNRKGNRVEETIYNNPNGKIYSQNVSVFDKDGRLIEYIMLDGLTGGENRHYKYSFKELDKNGNWIKRKTEFYYDRDGKLELSSTLMTYREIIYF